MSTEKLTRDTANEKLSEYRGSQNDAAVSARIDHARYIIKHLSDNDVDRIDSLKVLVEMIDRKLHNESSHLDNIDEGLLKALDDLQKVKLSNTYGDDAKGNEVKKYTKGKKKRRAVSILFLTLFACGAIVTVVFAFLDNFHVIDYGGTAAGASGIVDLAIGVFAFVVERINDWKTTSGMEAAEKVHDSKTYGVYINKSFYKNKIIDKRKVINYYGDKNR